MSLMALLAGGESVIALLGRGAVAVFPGSLRRGE
jgi:hypothetical protein